MDFKPGCELYARIEVNRFVNQRRISIPEESGDNSTRQILWLSQENVCSCFAGDVIYQW
jgi:hypothetical protein